MKFLTANKFIIAALALCLSACVFVFIISLNQTKKVKATSEEVIHTNRVLGSLDRLITTTLELQTSTRGFLISGDEQLLEPYKNASAFYKEALEKIKQQEDKRRIYTKQLDSLEIYIAKRLTISEKIIGLCRQQKIQDAEAIVASGEGSFYTNKIRSICEEMKLNELRSQDKTRINNEKAIKGLNTLLYFALVIVASLGILLFVRVKKSFNEHRNGEAKFKALLESAPDPMLISDNYGIIQLANKRAIDLTGYSIEELNGMSVENLIPHEVREKHKFLRDDYSKSPRVRHIDSGIEMQALHKDGKIIPVEISLSPIQTNGETFVAAALRDITQRKAAQHEIQTLFTQINEASEAIYSVNSNLIIESWNRGAENLYGYSKAEAIGKNSLQLLRTELTKEDMDDALSQIEKNGFWSGEVKRFNKQGEETYVYSSLSEVNGNNGHPKSYVSVSFDITQRKKLEEQIKHLASIVENSSEAILSRDMNRRIITWNKGAEKMFGYTKEEAIGKSVTELGVMRIADVTKLKLEETINKTGEWQEEINYYHKNGSVIYGAVTGNAVKDNNGNVTALSFVIKNITERKQLEQHLRNYSEELEQKINERTKEITISESKYRLLYNNNPLPMFVLDLETFRFLDMNESAERLYGYSRNEFQSMSALDIRPEEDRKAFLGLDHSFESTLNSDNRGIWRHIKKDGTIINVEIFGQSIYYEGREARLILVNNVTEKLKAEQRVKKSEKRFRALIENSYDIITMLDKDFKIIYRTPSAIRVTGREDAEVLGGNALKGIHPDDLEMVSGKIKQLLAKPGNTGECTFRYQHKNGSWLWFEGNATNLLHDENVRAVVFNYREVTERINAENALLSSEKRFRSLIENGSDIINLLDDSFRVIYRSPSAAKQGSLTDEDVMGKDGRLRIHPADLPLINEGIKRLLAKPGNIETTLFRYRMEDNRYIWLEGTATNMLYDEAVKAIVFNYREVTERIESEKKLKASEERYRTTLDNMIEGVQIIGFDWKYKYVNDAVIKQAKCTREELLGFTMMERYPGIENTDLFKTMQTCLTDRKPILLENKFVYPDGSISWFELSIQPVQEGIFILSVDITERVKAAEELKEEKDKLATIATTSPGLIYSFRMKPDGTFSFPFVSNAIEDIFGISAEKIKDNVNPLIEEALVEDVDLVISSIKQSAINMTPWQLAFRYHHPSKGVIWLEGNSIPMKEADGGIIWHGIIMDITKRVKMDKELENERDKIMKIADTSPGLIYTFRMMPDGTFNCPFTSNAIEEIFGISHDEANSNIAIIIERTADEDREMLVQSIQESALNMSQWQIVFRYNHPQRGKIWLQGNSLPVKDGDGNILWHGIILDITEQKNTEEKVTEKNAQLETLSNNLPGVMIYQLSGENFNERRFTYVSKEVTRLTGKTPDEVLADPSILYGLILEEDMPKLIASEIESFKNFSMFNEEIRCKTQNGEIRWLNIISTPRKTIEGKIVWDGFHVDITERKRNEAALRNSYIEKRMLAEKLTTILNTLPANIALLDEEGTIVDVNHSWMETAAENGWYGANYGLGGNYVALSENNSAFEYKTNSRQTISDGINGVLKRTTDKFVFECHTYNKKYWYRKIVSPLSGDGYTGAVVMHIDISQIHLLEEERLQRKNEEQKIITTAILQGQEKERNAIGKELHDNINQILAGINMLMGLIVKRPERMDELLPICIDNVNIAIKENRKLAHELTSPNEDMESLDEMIQRVIKNMLQSAGINTRLVCKHFDEALLSKEQKLAAYRIVQEQCNNIVKYAKAQKTVVLLHTSATAFILIIKDDGCGMDLSKKSDGIGIQNIKSRVSVFNGQVNITTKPGQGFMLAVEIPIAKQVNTKSSRQIRAIK